MLQVWSPSLLSLMPSSHALLGPLVSSPSTRLSSPFPGAKPASLALCASNSCVLLFYEPHVFCPVLVVEEKPSLRPWGSRTGPED